MILPIRRNSEQGATLMIVLIILAVLSVLGVSTLSNTTMEMKMAGNLEAKKSSEQIARGVGDAIKQTKVPFEFPTYPLGGITQATWTADALALVTTQDVRNNITATVKFGTYSRDFDCAHCFAPQGQGGSAVGPSPQKWNLFVIQSTHNHTTTNAATTVSMVKLKQSL